MKSGIKGVVCVLGLMLSGSAHAWTFDGNPHVSIHIDRNAGDLVKADVIVEAVRMHKCSGGEIIYDIDQTLNLKNALTLTIADGDYCALSVDYASSIDVEIANAWTALHHESSTTIELDEDGSSSAVVTPLQLTSGSTSGGFPRVFVDIN